jgi:chromosome transmission fidelity protein 4
MFASAIAAGKLERALDLTERLHLEKSFDLAMTIADNHRKLVSLIEKSKEKKFELRFHDEDIDTVENSSFPWTDRKRISPDSVAMKGKHQLGDSFSRNIRPKIT